MDDSRAPRDQQVYSQPFDAPSGTEKYLASDGMAQTALPPSGLSFNVRPMSTPATWADQQLVCGIPLDLRTPSLDYQNPSTTDWNVSWAQIAASSSTTPELAAPTLPGPSMSVIPSFDASMSTPRQPLPQRSGGPTRPSPAGKRNHDRDDERMNGVSDEGSEEDEKLKISRERNRVAAAKTRRKKKRSAKEIEDRAREIEQTNTLLHQEVRVLRDEFSTLRYCALSHDPTAGCKCTPLHRYNEHRAKEIAKEVAKGI